MGRRPRIEYDGAVYHVIQRGNNKEYVFDNDQDKEYLIEQLKEYKRGLGFRLFGYVVMGNHYHLLLQMQEHPLHKFMHRLNSDYGRYYNNKYQRSGHVFQGRYKAILVQDERYLMAVLRYIHRNPVVAGMCLHPAEYPYSSDGHYRAGNNWLVDIEFILDSFTDNRPVAIELYGKYMVEEDDSDYEGPDIIGDEAFTMALRPKAKAPERKSLDDILVDTGVSLDDFKLIKDGSRMRHLLPYKKLYVKAALHQKYTFREIGGNIGLSDIAAIKLVRPR